MLDIKDYYRERLNVEILAASQFQAKYGLQGPEN